MHFYALLLDRVWDWFSIEGFTLKLILVPIYLLYGVPQDSVLGPLLFILKTTLLSKILCNHKDLQHHFYANDIHLFNKYLFNKWCNMFSQY